MLWLQVCNWRMTVVALAAAAPDENTETEQRMPISSDLLGDCQSLYCDAAAKTHKNTRLLCICRKIVNCPLQFLQTHLKGPTSKKWQTGLHLEFLFVCFSHHWSMYKGVWGKGSLLTLHYRSSGWWVLQSSFASGYQQIMHVANDQAMSCIHASLTGLCLGWSGQLFSWISIALRYWTFFWCSAKNKAL